MNAIMTAPQTGPSVGHIVGQFIGRIVFTAFHLDFWRRPWRQEEARIVNKSRVKEWLDGSHYFFKIYTEHGTGKLEVTEAVYNARYKGQRIDVDVQTSRWYPDRIRLRLARRH